MTGTMEQPPEDIIRRCRARDAEAFCAVVGLYERPLFGFVHRLLWNSAYAGDCEDVVQEIFLKCYASIESYRQDRGQFSSWLFRIAHNHCISLLRKRLGPLAMPASLDDITESRAIPAGSTPRDAACEAETSARIAILIDALPQDQKVALLLRCYEDMSYEQIAEVQGCSAGTAKTRVFRAREKLSEQLREFLPA